MLKLLVITLNKVDYEKEDEEGLVMVCKLRILLLFIKFTIKRRNERYETIWVQAKVTVAE